MWLLPLEILSKSEVDQIHNYYGVAIHRNKNDLENIRKDVWAILHKSAADDNPQHHFWPKSEDFWCKYNWVILTGENYSHKNSLPVSVISIIFADLSHSNLLQSAFMIVNRIQMSC